MRKVIFPACALSTALLLIGCSYVTPTTTQDEATEKGEEHADDTLAALPEGAELEERRGPNLPLAPVQACWEQKKRVAVGENLWIRGIPEEENETALDLMHDHWDTHGYQIVTDNRPDDPFVNARHEEDDFHVLTQYNKNGTLSLTIGSPCLWPDGTPEIF